MNKPTVCLCVFCLFVVCLSTTNCLQNFLSSSVSRNCGRDLLCMSNVYLSSPTGCVHFCAQIDTRAVASLVHTTCTLTYMKVNAHLQYKIEFNGSGLMIDVDQNHL